MPDGLNIYQDTREKKPWKLRRYPCETEEVRLVTGDYCLAGDGTMTDDGFDPNFVVERKGQGDFLQSITWERDRFEAELERADSFEHRMPIIVEQNLQYFKDGRHYPDVPPNSITATIDAHAEMYNVDYYFTRDRQRAAQLGFEFLEWRADNI